MCIFKHRRQGDLDLEDRGSVSSRACLCASVHPSPYLNTDPRKPQRKEGLPALVLVREKEEEARITVPIQVVRQPQAQA